MPADEAIASGKFGLRATSSRTTGCSDDWDSALELGETLLGEDASDVDHRSDDRQPREIAIDRGDLHDARDLLSRSALRTDSSDLQTARSRLSGNSATTRDRRLDARGVGDGSRDGAARTRAAQLVRRRRPARGRGKVRVRRPAITPRRSLSPRGSTSCRRTRIRGRSTRSCTGCARTRPRPRETELAATEAFGIALANARNLGYRYWLAPILYDYGRWLVATERVDEGEQLLAEARALFEHMGATVWLERLDGIRGVSRVLA